MADEGGLAGGAAAAVSAEVSAGAGAGAGAGADSAVRRKVSKGKQKGATIIPGRVKAVAASVRSGSTGTGGAGGAVVPCMTLDAADTQYQVVRNACDRLGWKVIEADGSGSAEADIKWHDAVIKPNDMARMKKTGIRWNHFPAIEALCTKCGLQQTLSRISDKFPKDFKFVPRSWSLPVQRVKLKHFLDTKGTKNGVTFIVKPNTSSRGRGIYLTQTMPESTESAVVQEYIARPLTIEAYKFDLRLYMLITDMRCSVMDMPRVFLHHEGLVRFCTTEYVAPTQANMDDNTIHLSNYSVNKWSSQFVKETGVKEHLKSMSEESRANGGLLPRGGQYRFGGGENGALGTGLEESELVHRCRGSQEGSKWTLTAFADWAEAQGHDVGLLWRRCVDLVCKTTLAAAVRSMKQEYTSNFDSPSDDGLRCFEVLGIDVMLNEKLQPFLLEVNMSPSAAMGTALDMVVKETVHQEALKIAAMPPMAAPSGSVAVSTQDEHLWREQYEAKVCHGFQRILPPPDPSTKRAATYNAIAALKDKPGLSNFKKHAMGAGKGKGPATGTSR